MLIANFRNMILNLFTFYERNLKYQCASLLEYPTTFVMMGFENVPAYKNTQCVTDNSNIFITPRLKSCCQYSGTHGFNLLTYLV